MGLDWPRQAKGFVWHSRRHAELDCACTVAVVVQLAGWLAGRLAGHVGWGAQWWFPSHIACPQNPPTTTLPHPQFAPVATLKAVDLLSDSEPEAEVLEGAADGYWGMQQQAEAPAQHHQYPDLLYDASSQLPRDSQQPQQPGRLALETQQQLVQRPRGEEDEAEEGLLEALAQRQHGARRHSVRQPGAHMAHGLAHTRPMHSRGHGTSEAVSMCCCRPAPCIAPTPQNC